MVATQKVSQELEETWNNLYAGYIKGDASNLVLQSLLEDEQRAKCGVLLTAVKSKIYAVNSCIKNEEWTSTVVVGVITNEFHEYWWIVDCRDTSRE